ncbi:hypothetical protein EJ05DRAFT_507496 [Pseudovirgaria hyperparasitica]|uniref:t-SNARE coiled-coil homology domain-containing protein n=1 Tax=Pseudovirgaria hyperparasitica TaxID=470096 RepID=A0A6A6WIG9_9PEZI|nr:uncharacterized protein EJ05DRAFT_507496 [Pseudovirgaria hyperparasitica]KAF2761880.1 hypothetical protein EJ05DRAFT_507496 [Pseudovirgaria hyperparasitica]
MSSSNPSQLFLLADHIKLSLLERQRAISLNLEPNSHDGQISRSLESLSSGIEALEARPDSTYAQDLPRLKSQLSALQSQFHGFGHSPDAALTSPNSSSLAPDFAAAQKPASKSVRFTDASSSSSPPTPASPDPNRAALFPARYTDEPSEPSAVDAQAYLSNEQIHMYHQGVIQEQDEQLDTLGRSIGRQRELSMQIGNELDDHVMLLEDVEEGVNRHQSTLNRARSNLDNFSRKAKDNWSLSLIVVLIVILVLLIVIFK